MVLPLLNAVVTVTPAAAATAHMASTIGTSQLLVQFTPTASATDIAAAVSSVSGTDVKTMSDIQTHEVDVPSGTEASAIATLQANPAVVNAAQEVTMQTASIPNDPGYSNQWALPKISWDGAYGSITPSGHATIAVLDTGVDASHPDLSGVVNTSNSISEVGGNPTTDPNGHGTEMAGIAAASVNNNTGMAGVDYAGASVSSVQVLGANGTGNDANVTAGVLWAADHGANVILMSIYTTGYSSALANAISYAQSKGVLVVASTGNSASNVPTYPAGDPGVLGVTATDQNDALLSTDDLVSADVAAPGSGIYATQPGGNYGYVSGTSPAAAEAAGLAGLLIANGDSATQAYNQITGSADPLSGEKFGRINVLNALGGAPVTVTPQPTVSSTPEPVPSPTYVASALGVTAVFGASGGSATITGTGSGTNAQKTYQFSYTSPAPATTYFQPCQLGSSPVTNTFTIPTGAPSGTWTVRLDEYNASDAASCAPDGSGSSKRGATTTATATNATISGTVYNDLNGNGGFNTGEPGVSGVTVTLSGGASGSTTTDSNGNYAFTVTPAAGGTNYTVTYTVPANFVNTGTSTSISISALKPGQASTGDNFFAQQRNASIAGTLYDDLNGNGSLDAGEPTLSGVTVTLSGTASGTTTTNSGGQYTFNGLAAGGYSVTDTAPTNYQNTGTNPLPVTLTAGQSSAGNNLFTEPLATHVTFSQQPTNTTTGTAISPAVTVNILGPANELVKYSTASVTLSITANTGTSGATLTGGATAAVAGVASFGNLKIDKAGTGYTLTATSETLTSAVSSAFDVASSDTTPPSSAVSFPANNGTYNASGYTAGCNTASTDDICGTASDTGTGVSKVEVSIKRNSDGTYWNGSAFSGTTQSWNLAGGTTSWTYNFNRPADGAYTVQSRATDGANNVETPGAGNTFTIDTVAPPVTINTEPSNPSNSSSATFTFSSTDGTATFQCQIDGGSFASCASPTAYSSLTNGSHTFTVKATDPAGNSSTASYTWTIDTVAPSSTVTFPASNGTYNASSYTAGCGTGSTDDICGTASDAGTGVNKVEVSILGTSGPNNGKYWNGTSSTWVATQTWNTAAGTTSWTYNFTRPADGGYTVQSRATDNATNVETPGAGNTFTIDTVPPANLTASPPGGTYTTSQSVTLSATDTGGSGVNALYYTTDGSAPTTSSARFTAPISIGTNTTLKFIAVDNAGNTSSVATQTYAVDTTTPTSAITFPVSGHTYNSTSWNAGCTTPGICGTASDTGSGVASVTVTIFQASSNKYYDGSGFNSATPVSLGATGTTGWSYAFPLSKMTDGSYTVTSTSTDAAGNAQTTAASSTFTIDTTAPTVTVNQASGQNDPTNSQPIHFTAVFSEPVNGFDNTKVTLGGTAGHGSASVTVNPAGGNSYDISVSGLSSDGAITASIAANAVTDGAGNGNTASASTDNQVTYDNTKPVLSVSHTTNGTNGYNTSSPVTVTITASDATSGLAGTPTCTDGSTSLTLTGSSGNWTTSVSGDGTHSINCSVSDNAGNTQTASDTVKIDSVAPSVSLTDPRTVSGTYVTTTTPTFSGTGGTVPASSSTSADSSSVTVTIYNGTGTGGTTFQTLTASVGSGGAYTTAASNALTLGNTYTVVTTQADGAGNTGTSSAYTFTVAQKPGAPTIGTPTSGDGFATVVWNPASDNGAAITSYTITPYISGTAGTPQTFNATGSPSYSCSTSCSATFSGLQNGTTYTFSLHATNPIGDGPESAQSVVVTPTVGLCSGFATASLALCGVSVGNFGAITLNGTDQQTYAQLSSINVQDQQTAGGNTGWKLLIQASQLKCTSADSGCPASGDTMSANRLFMAGPLPSGSGGSVCVSGCNSGSLVTPQNGTPFAIDTGDASGSAVKIADYTGGDASYTLVPGALDGNGNNLQLTVPASAYTTTYHTTVTVTVASGPS